MIGIIDCNNFFVSCERVFRPDLWNKPVVVLSSNDGCVVARSQEVKDIGVPMGVPYFKVKDILKTNNTTVFSSHFALYRDFSQRVFSTLEQEILNVQKYSIDEAFFEISDAVEAQDLAIRIKDKIEREVGIPISVGIGPSKTLAKYANDRAKKTNGVHILTAEEWDLKAATTPLGDIWGVGYRMAEQYRKHGITTAQSLIDLDPERTKTLFGVAGVRLRQALSGLEEMTIKSEKEVQKSIMNSRSFKETTTDIEVLFDAVAYHVRQATAELRSMNLKTSRIRVSIRPSRHSDYVLQGGAAEAVLLEPIDDTFSLVKTANDLVQTLYKPGVPYKKAGIILSSFSSKDLRQENLFQTAVAEDTTALMEIIDAVNKKRTGELLTVGSRLLQSQWTAKIDARSPAYTTRWEDVAMVRA